MCALPALRLDFENPDGNNPSGNDPTNRLIAASRHNDILNMRRAVDEGANKLSTGSTGENIYTAAAGGDALSAIDYGARELDVWIDASDRHGKTGLFVSLEHTHPRAATKFLAYGANPLTVGKNGNYRVLHCFQALEAALHKDKAVENRIVNATWSPVVGGMIHRLFNPEFWPDDRGVVWQMHIPPFVQQLTLASGVRVADMHAERTAVYETLKAEKLRTAPGLHA